MMRLRTTSAETGGSIQGPGCQHPCFTVSLHPASSSLFPCIDFLFTVSLHIISCSLFPWIGTHESNTSSLTAPLHLFPLHGFLAYYFLLLFPWIGTHARIEYIQHRQVQRMGTKLGHGFTISAHEFTDSFKIGAWVHCFSARVH
jgi:hypothetical protein